MVSIFCIICVIMIALLVSKAEGGESEKVSERAREREREKR